VPKPRSNSITLRGAAANDFVNAAMAKPCPKCKGYGHFKANGKPSIDGRDRKCLDCAGTGKRLS
jgi:DnaJ-class molecular chaperone